MAMVENEREQAGRRAIRRRGARCSSGSQTENVRFIHLWFTDLEGHLKSFSITPAELEDALDDGMGFDGSSITGLQPDRGVATWSRSRIRRRSSSCRTATPRSRG